MNSPVLFIIVGIFVGYSRAQVPFLGACPNRSVVQDFDVKQYLGRWYEIEKYHAAFEAGGTCVQTYYSDQGNGTIGIINSQVSGPDQRVKSIEGTARFTKTDGSAKLAVRFPSIPLVGQAISAPYWVLDTDYKNYSIVWSCTDLMLFNFQILWFLSREREPTAELKNMVHDKMDEIGIRRDLLQKTVQTHCSE